ncbi:hypothetical protein JCM10207_002015 [Rhodosporidiobolus poonsookiae]
MDSSSSPTSTIGAVFIGLVFAIFLTSSAVHWTSSYCKKTSDPWQWQVGVVFLTAVNTAHTAIICHSLYGYLVVHFGDRDNLMTAEWDLVAHYAIFITLSLVVQLYYALRISTLYAGKIRVALLASISLFTLAQLAFGIAATYYTATLRSSFFEIDLRKNLGWQTLASSLAGVLCDLVIFGATFADMRTARFAVLSESPLAVLSRLFVETNFITTIVAILSLAFGLAWNAQNHPSGISTAFAIVIPKLYLLSMLVSINRGADTVRSGLDPRSIKHTSSLSDMFKGTPVSRFTDMSASRIGRPNIPTPIADQYAGGGRASEATGWLRRVRLVPYQPLQPIEVPLAPFASASSKDRPVTAFSVSDYGDYFLGTHRTGSANEKSAMGSIPHDGISTAVDMPSGSQTPTPRKATFHEGDVVLNGMALQGDASSDGAVSVSAGSGRQPVRYGYL